jgi:hypothetical protein
VTGVATRFRGGDISKCVKMFVKTVLRVILSIMRVVYSVAAFLSRFFIVWEIKYIKPPKYLAR